MAFLLLHLYRIATLMFISNVQNKNVVVKKKKDISFRKTSEQSHSFSYYYGMSRYGSFTCDVIAAMLEDNNQIFLISFYC